MIETSCKYCLFAEYDGNTQTGCKFDRIEKFEENGAEVIEAYDDEKEFYVIKGRFCNACRNENWIGNKKKKDFKKITAKEFQVQYDVIINVALEDDVDTVQAAIDSVTSQTIKPKNIIVVTEYNYPQREVVEILAYLKEIDIEWHLEQLANKDTDPIDNAAKDCKSMYFAILNASDALPEDFAVSINNAINYEMIRFCLVTGPHPFVQTSVYKQVAGNHERNFMSKIQEWVKDENLPDFIRSYSDL